jgi:hypothetical protein
MNKSITPMAWMKDISPSLGRNSAQKAKGLRTAPGGNRQEID